MIAKFANAVSKVKKEGFGEENKKETTVTFIVFLIWLFLVFFIGMLLWNNVLTKAITVVKPVQWYQFIGIVLLSMILFPCNM